MTRLVVLVVCGTFLLVAANAQEPDDDVASLIAQLKGKDPKARGRAAKELGRAGGEEAIAALGDALGDDSEPVRHEAAIALARLAPDNAKVVEVLIESLKNEDWYVRWQACLALRALGPRAGNAVPALISVLRNAPLACQRAPKGREIVHACELCEAGLDVSREATLALGAIAPKKPEVVSALLGLLDARQLVDRQAVVFALGRGGKAGHAIPWLAHEVHTNQHGLADNARRLLRRVAHSDAECFLQLLGPDEKARLAAAERIAFIAGNHHPPWRLAVPALMLALEDESWLVRWQVLYALGHVGPSAKPAIPGIIPNMVASQKQVRDVAYDAVKAVAPSLARVIEVGTDEKGAWVAQLFFWVDPPRDKGAAALLALLLDPAIGDETLGALAQITRRTKEDLLKEVRAQAARESNPKPRKD